MQGVGNAPQTQDGGIALALFNLTDVGMALNPVWAANVRCESPCCWR